jgi:hypothetical protein
MRHSPLLGERMPREEASEGLAKRMRLLQWQQVVRSRHHQAFDSRQPFEQPLVALVVDRAAVAADQEQHGRLHSSRVSRAKLPGVHRRCSDLEERVHILLDLLQGGCAECPLDDAAVLRSTDALKNKQRRRAAQMTL